MVAGWLLIHVVVEGHRRLLQSPSTCRLQLALSQFGKFLLLLPIRGRGIPQPVVLGSRQTLIALGLQYLVFSPAHSIDRFAQMLGNVKFVEHDLFLALRKNLTGPAILAGLVFGGKRYPPPSWLGKCGNPVSVAGFPSAVGTVEKSGLDFSTVPTARHFHSQALDSGPFWLGCRPWAHWRFNSSFSEPATDAHFSRFLRRAQ